MFLYVSQNGQKIPTDEKYVEKTATTDSKNRVPTPAAESHAERTLSTENKNRSRSQALVEKVTRGTVLYERTPLHIHTKKHTNTIHYNPPESVARVCQRQLGFLVIFYCGSVKRIIHKHVNMT